MMWQEQQLFLVTWKFLAVWPRAKRTGSSVFRAPLFLYHFGSASIALTTSPKGPLDHVLQIRQCELLYDSFLLTDLSVWYLSLTELSQEWCRMWTQNRSHECVNGWCPEFYLSFFLKNNIFSPGLLPKVSFWWHIQITWRSFYTIRVLSANSDRVTQSGGRKALGMVQKIPRWFKMACKVEKLWDSDVGWPHLGQFTKYGCLGPTPRDFHLIGLSLGSQDLKGSLVTVMYRQAWGPQQSTDGKWLFARKG